MHYAAKKWNEQSNKYLIVLLFPIAYFWYVDKKKGMYGIYLFMIFLQ